MKIGFLGGGNMAHALIGGLLQQGFPAGDLHVADPGEAARSKLQETYSTVNVYSGADQLPVLDVIVLAVKPQQMKEAVQPLVPQLSGALVVSIAAGLSLETLSRFLGGYRRIVRTMPNTPAMVGAGMTGLCALPEVDAAARARAEQILRAVGQTLWLEEESRMDGVTALSGSGPAYVFLFIEALQAAASDLGFSLEEGRQLALATIQGAAELAARSPEPAATLRERVTSKGGTTEAALNVMATHGVKAGIMAGVMAAAARGEELGRQLGAA